MPTYALIQDHRIANQVRHHLAAKIRLLEPQAYSERNEKERSRLKACIDTYCEVYRDLVGRDPDE